MIIDAHSHAWRYPDHFQEDFRRQAIRARAGQEVDLTVKFSEYQETSPEEVRTIVFGGKARLSGLWVEDQYVYWLIFQSLLPDLPVFLIVLAVN